MPRNFFFLLVPFLIAFSGTAQRIANFSLYQSNNSVLVKFSLTPGPQCNGWQVMWGADSTNFQPIYTYAGICGDYSQSTSFSYTHTGPYPNQYNYYRIMLQSPFEQSSTRSIFVGKQASTATMLAYPNPVTDNGYSVLNFKIPNASNLPIYGFVYDGNGHPLMEISQITNGDTFTINVSAFRNGLYIARVTDGYLPYFTKFIVLK